MDKKGWRLLKHKRDCEAEEYNQFPFVVMLVVQEGHAASRYVEAERYATEEEAVSRAEFINGNGAQNVIVFNEVAFCVRKESL